jgi:hypothetical protein
MPNVKQPLITKRNSVSVLCWAFVITSSIFYIYNVSTNTFCVIIYILFSN